MPTIVKHNTASLPAQVGLASNVGLDRTGRLNFRDNLAIEDQAFQQDMARREAERRDRDEQVRAFAMLLSDDRSRDLAGQRLQGAIDLAGVRGQYGLDQAQAAADGRLQVAGLQQAGANDRSAAAIAARAATALQRDETQRYGIDQRTAAAQRGQDFGYDLAQRRMAQQADLAQRRFAEQAALEENRRMAQAEAQAGRTQAAAARAQAHAEIGEMQQQRSILERRAADGDPQAPQYIDFLNAEIQRRLGAILPAAARQPQAVPQVQPQQAAPAQARPALPAQPTPQDAGNPLGAAAQPITMGQPPRVVRDAGGRAYLFSGQFDPRTGEPLYAEAVA